MIIIIYSTRFISFHFLFVSFFKYLKNFFITSFFFAEIKKMQNLKNKNKKTKTKTPKEKTLRLPVRLLPPFFSPLAI